MSGSGIIFGITMLRPLFILLFVALLFGCAAIPPSAPSQYADGGGAHPDTAVPARNASSDTQGNLPEAYPDDSAMNATDSNPAAPEPPAGEQQGACVPPSTDWEYPPPNLQTGNRSLLVILWDPHREGHPAPQKDEIEEMIFGPAPSVRDYFYNESGGKFFLGNAKVLGWFDSIKDAGHYWGPADPDDSDGDGWTSGHTEKWAEAIRKADSEFDFASFDKNHDGALSPGELGILIVIPQNSPFGTNRPALGRQYPVSEPLIVDGVRIGMIAEWYAGNPPDMGTAAHELSHLFLGTPDMYFWFFQPYAAGSYSLMDNSYGNSRHDAYNKLRLGWLEPKTTNQSGCYRISKDAERATVLVLPNEKGDEFFLIENRQRGEFYDSALPDTGISIWDVMEDPAVYGSLGAPKGVDERMWAQVPPHDWGRRMIRQIRPSYGPPFDNYRALWDESDMNGTPLVLRWHDGTESGYTITNISGSGPVMNVTLAVPS